MNTIDILSQTKTTPEIYRHYERQGGVGIINLHRDMETCSKGNRLALEALLGYESKLYHREAPERPLDENVDIVQEIREG